MKIKYWVIVVSLVLQGCTYALVSQLTPNGGGSSGLTSLLVLLGLNRPSGGSSGYSISSSFSFTNNPNGVWSYGWKSTATGSFTIYTLKRDSGGLRSWYDTSDTNPSFANNYSSSTLFGIAPGELSLHPGSSGQISVLRWTAPQAGTISIKGSFKSGDSGSVDVYVLKNTTSLFSKTSTLITESYDQTTTVAIGDTVDFQVGYAGNYTNDSTPIDGVITYQGESSVSITLSPTAGHYNTPQYIQATSSPSTAKVYYTIDGTEPTESSTLYSKSIHIYGIAGKTLKFKAFSGGSSSTTVTAIYSYPPLKTGQTTSYATGDDANLNQGVTRSYTDNGDGTILDNATGLTWQKCSRGQSGTTCATGSATNADWATSVSYCNGLGLAGKTWRLPTIIELRTLADFSKQSPTPMINLTFFPNNPLGDYLTSTVYALNTDSVILLNNGGGTTNGLKVAGFLARCVSD